MRGLVLIVMSCMVCHAQAQSVVRLRMEDAIRLALGENITAIRLARKSVLTAEGKVLEARSATALIAQASVADRVLQVDLRALGIDLPRFSELVSSTQFPGTRGPYSVFDPRIQATKILIDKSAKRKVAAAAKGVEEAQSTVAEEREMIAAETARVYLQAVRSSEVAQLAQGSLHMAETMLDFATERCQAGLAGEGELRRARVNINSEQQKLSALRLEQSQAVLRLLYLVGGSFADTLELATIMPLGDATQTVEEAVAQALRDNPRLRTLRVGEERLRLTYEAVSATWLPVLSTYGDIGVVIVAPSPSGSALATHGVTFTAGVELKIPIFDGHRRALAHGSVLSQISEQQLKQRAFERQVEWNVRVAHASLTAAAKQADLAESSGREAAAEMEEVRANRAAGNASGLDLRQAAQAHAVAMDVKAAAVYAQAQARLALAEAMGRVSSLQW